MICDKSNCTGCAACYVACPKNAIYMESDDEGFTRPVINKNLCINCGICIKTCPANSYIFDNLNSPEVYAVMTNDELRKTSTSGGAFGVLANHVLDKNGVVCGAAFNNRMQVEHIMIFNKKDLIKIQGSKYVQSQNNDIYQQIKQYLDMGRFVLYSGCACQVAGLNKFLNKKYDNLITLDLICHGVPSPMILKKYLNENYPNEKVLNVNFRDKSQNGWGRYITTITTTKGKYSDSENEYMKAFFSNLSLRECCYECKYAKFPRPADFTIGDCWGISKDMDDKKGTSILIANNNKAIKLFRYVKKDFKKVKKMNVKYAKSFQPNLSQSSSKHPAREEFFEKLNSCTLKEAYETTVCSNKNITLLNFHWENSNFGAVLTSCALNMFLSEIGYNVQNINYIPTFPWIREEKENRSFDEFRKKYLPLTKRIYEYSQLEELNDNFKTFIVGSDQVFRYPFIKHDMEAFFLNFADSDKNIVSAAASFGSEEVEEESKKVIDLYKLYLSNFNSLSIREKSGVDYCNKLGIKATQIIDPVFYMKKDKWIEIANKANNKKEADFVYYTINSDIEKDIINFANKNKMVLNINSIENITENLSIEEWLYKIMNCKFFVADSFHGICFAIIFNKPFLCVRKQASTRMQSLLESVQIENRLYKTFEEIDLNKIVQPIDYNKTNQNIFKLKEFSTNWLINAIENPINNPDLKSKNKKEILKIQLKLARKNYLKFVFKSKLYKVRAYLKKTKAQKHMAKADSARYIYRNCKFIIRKARKK